VIRWALVLSGVSGFLFFMRAGTLESASERVNRKSTVIRESAGKERFRGCRLPKLLRAGWFLPVGRVPPPRRLQADAGGGEARGRPGQLRATGTRPGKTGPPPKLEWKSRLAALAWGSPPMNKLCTFGGAFVGSYAGWFLGMKIGLGTAIVVSGLAALAGVYAGWKLAQRLR
jgi:hypothetical protein